MVPAAQGKESWEEAESLVGEEQWQVQGAAASLEHAREESVPHHPHHLNGVDGGDAPVVAHAPWY